MDLITRVAPWLIMTPVVLFLVWHLFLAVSGPIMEAKLGALVDFESLKLGWTPNQFLLVPDDQRGPHLKRPSGSGSGTVDQGGPDLVATSPVSPMAPTDLADTLKKIVVASPRTRILREREDGLAFSAVQRSALMRYPDFVSLEVRPAEGGSTVLVYSRSVFGIRDFGVNRARVEGWLAELAAPRVS